MLKVTLKCTIGMSGRKEDEDKILFCFIDDNHAYRERIKRLHVLSKRKTYLFFYFRLG